QPADRGPVELVASLCEKSYEPIMKETCEGQGHAQVLSRGDCEAHILEAQGRGESSRLETPLRDQFAIGLVGRRAEEGRGQDVEILMTVDAAFRDERHGFSQGFDHAGDEKIAAQLHQVGSLRCVADKECSLADGIEQGIGGIDRIASARGDDEELARGRYVGSAEYWSGDETLAGRGVVGTAPLRSEEDT